MRKKSESKKQTKKILTVLLVLLVIIIAAVIVGVSISKSSHKRSLEQEQTTKAMTLPKETEAEVEQSVINFAIFGVDSRNSSAAIGDQNRSDAIMIVSVNTEKNSVKLISVMRDSKVPIDGYEPQKINAAYKYGGSALALKTLNTNFDLDLRNYVMVDFGRVKRLINLIGGVDVEITADEASIINSQNPDSSVVSEGTAHLDGSQALSYSRIRSLDSDYNRVSRQQNVLDAVLHKLNVLGTSKSLDLLRSFMDCIDTSFFYEQLYSIMSKLDFATIELSRYTVPDYDANPELWGGIDETGSWVWEYDLESAAKRINEIIAE